MTRINIQFTLFSALYSPLISTMSGGFLEEEGLEPEYSVAAPGVTAIAALEDGSAHVVQSALSQGFTSLNKGEIPTAVHFAQINEMDGFFLTGREADQDFTWDKLEGADVVLFNGGQPLAMFKYACNERFGYQKNSYSCRNRNKYSSFNSSCNRPGKRVKILFGNIGTHNGKNSCCQ